MAGRGGSLPEDQAFPHGGRLALSKYRLSVREGIGGCRQAADDCAAVTRRPGGEAFGEAAEDAIRELYRTVAKTELVPGLRTR